MTKQRLSASVDSDLIEAAENAVTSGRSESVSAWVNDALRIKLEQERRLEALAAFIAAYEDEHGEITPDEMLAAARRARASAITVRGTPAKKAASRRRTRR
jgi:Arc/MetJ-type ribon-helix-helix transcriptional regulator